MEKFSDQPIPENPAEKSSERKYNFEQIAGMKEGLVSLVGKLKDKIDAGYYETLISDEIRGRLPTLVLRKILQSRNHNKELQTYFLSLGRGVEYLNDDLQKFVDEKKDGLGHALFVTDMIQSASSLVTFLGKLGKDCDVATVFTNKEGLAEAFYRMGNYKEKQKVISDLPNDGGVIDFSFKVEPSGRYDLQRGETDNSSKLYVGSTQFYKSSLVSSDASSLTGVDKRTVPSMLFDESIGRWTEYIEGMYPEKLEKLKSNPESEREEYERAFGKTIFRGNDPYKYVDPGTQTHKDLVKEKRAQLQETRPEKKLTEEEIRQIQENVIKAREDINTMTEEILETVWKQ